jgi:hypothetical protein
MLQVEETITDSGLIEAYEQLCEQLGAVVPYVVERAQDNIGSAMLADFRTEPGPVVLPIEWTSDRQLRWYFATHKPPYRRTHALSQGWKLTRTIGGDGMTSLILVNESSALPFVEGFDQQQFHRNTGWFQYANKAAEWLAVLSDATETALIKLLYFQGEDGPRLQR